jgi:phage-related protein
VAADPYFRFHKSIEAVQTGIGLLVARIKEQLAPILEKAAGIISDVVGWMTKHKGVVDAVASAMGPFIGVLLGVAGAVKAWAVVQQVLNTALLNNPVGWIIAGIAALTGIVVYCYTHFAKFRAVLFGVWETVKEFGRIVGDIFSGLWHVIHGVFTLDASEIKLGSKQGLDAMVNAGNRLGSAFKKGYDDGLADFAKDQAKDNAPKQIKVTGANEPKVANTYAPTAGTETKGATGNKSTATTINIKIGDLVKELNLHSTTIQGGAKQIKDIITEVLLSAVNDSQQIAHD